MDSYKDFLRLIKETKSLLSEVEKNKALEQKINKDPMLSLIRGIEETKEGLKEIIKNKK